MKIKIYDKTKDQKVEAETYYISHSGKLAVTRHYLGDGKFDNEWFCVTHIPTGGMVTAHLFSTLKLATIAAKRLDTLDWNFRSPTSKKKFTIADDVGAILDEMQDAVTEN